ncbi:MAG: SDR family oxidoreductase [Deltaproteobacteria bacterium]|nr:SDR family oxidoreductase [Deltaproteobacteria bacterium]
MAKFDSVFRSDLFRDKVVLVTGGGSGIGRCSAHELAALGAKVVVAGRKREKLDVVVGEIVEDGGTALGVQLDVRKEDQANAAVAETISKLGSLDGLVNCAGGQFVSPVESISRNGFSAVVETNLTGTFLMCKEAYNAWMRDHGGAIVNVVADMWRGMPYMSHSGAARAGVVNLTQTMALEWAGAGVRVNAVAPGLIDSSGLDAYPPEVRVAIQGLPKELPAQRLGTESEVSSVIAFLLSPAAAYISGETVRVDSGSSLYRHPFAFPEHAPSPRFDGFHRRRWK